jgi:hypothetical protein
MDNYNLNHELSQYDHVEGIEFNGLMPKFMEKIGMTTGTSDKSEKMFEFHPAGSNSLEVIDTYEIMSNGEDGGSDGETSGSTSGETSGSTSGETSGKTEVETIADYEYIWNESTYNSAMSNEPLQAYYEDHPEEDCWNTSENRPVNYNDRKYTGTIDDVETSGTAKWESENAQMITIGNNVCYAPIFYGFDPQTVELYNDAELTESAGKSFVITKVSYDDNCPHSWNAVNKDAFPWVVVELPKPFEGTVKFVYDETNVVEKAKSAAHGYYIEQVAELFGSEYKLDNEGNTTFDESKLVVTLITEE